MGRYRILSLVCALVAALAAAAWIAVGQAAAFGARGTAAAESPTGFATPVRGAESLRIGVNAALEQYDPGALDTLLADLAGRGITHVRQEFRWEALEPARGAYDWAAADRVFAAARRHRISVLAMLWTTPGWARAPSGSAAFPAPPTAPPGDPADFARFARDFARRYDGPGSPLIGYQIWDEPNLSAAWGDALINPAAYLRLLNAAGDAIREVNPTARVVLAALAPTVVQSDVNLAPQAYLRALYELGARGAFDAAAAKPYGFNIPPDDRRVDLGLLNFSHVILMREEMVRQGDGDTAVWLTQFGWNAQLPDWTGGASPWSGVTEGQQAGHTGEAIRRAASEWHWVGAMFVESLQPNRPADDPRWGYALLDRQGRPRPVMQSVANAIEAVKGGAAPAPRAQAFSVCNAPRTPAVKPADCFTSNPAAEFSEGWRFSELGADIPQRDDARVRFTFTGDALALIVRRGDYRAYTFVTVDGRPANALPTEPGVASRGAYLIMTSADLAPRIETIEVASNLGPGVHTAEIRIDRGWNQWALIGWSSRVAQDGVVAPPAWARPALLLVTVAALAGLLVALRRARWLEALDVAWRRMRRPTALTAGAALAYWLAASLTWAQEATTAYRNLNPPMHIVVSGLASGVLFWSPTVVISLAALAVLLMLVLLRLESGLVLLAFFIPLYLIPQRLFARAFSMVELLTLMCLVSWAVRRLRGADGRLSLSGFVPRLSAFTLLDWGMIGLVAVSAISTLGAAQRVEAFRELRVVILESAAAYLIVRTTPLNSGGVRRVLGGLLAGAVCVAVFGLFNYARGDVFPAEGGLPRIKSVWGSPNNDALFLGRAWPLLLALAAGAWRGGGSRFARAALPLGFVAVSLALALSQSRGALLLGLPSALVAMAFAAGGRWRRLGIAFAVAAAAGLAVLLSGVAQPLFEGTRLGQALDPSRGTGFFRLNLWSSAIRMWLDHPLFGVGPDNFLYAYRGFYIAPAAWQEPNLSHAHSLVFDPLARLGALGLTAWLMVLTGVVRALRRGLARSDGPARAVLIGLAGVLADTVAHGIVDNSFFLVDLAFVFMLTAGLAAQLASAPVVAAPVVAAPVVAAPVVAALRSGDRDAGGDRSP